MVNFIICDDNKKINKTIETIVSKTMMKNKLAYKSHIFFDYDRKFKQIINTNLPCKVYILDIETPSASGIDIARRIRENDPESVIIFITSHEELGATILKSELMFLTFISKFDDYEKSTESAILKALNYLGKKNIIRFSDHGTVYTIPAKDILYITRDSIERKCIMKTDYTEFHLTKSLTQMLDMLDGNFVQTHRACIVNTQRVISVHSRAKEITFDTGEVIDLISDNYKGNIKNIKVKKEKSEVIVYANN